MSQKQFEACLKRIYKDEVNYEVDDGVIHFKSCDAKYEIKIPKYDARIPTETTLKVIHVRGKTGVKGGDIGVLKITLDNDGIIADFDPNIEIGEDSLGTILGWVGFTVGVVLVVTPFAVATAATCGGALLAVAAAPAVLVTLSATISAAALSVPTAIGVGCAGTAVGLASTLLGGLSAKMIRWTDDGGRVHFPQVLAHAAARLQIAVMETRTGESFAAAMIFDKKKWFDVVRDADTKLFDDRQWAKDDTALEYKYKDDKYRTWMPDVTVCWGNSVVMLSFKIDCDRNNKVDDHTLVLVVFDMDGRVICGQAVVAMENEPTVTVAPIVFDVNNVPVKVPTAVGKTVVAAGDSSIEDALADSIKADMKDNKHWSDWSEQRKHISTIVRYNIDWFQRSLKRRT